MEFRVTIRHGTERSEYHILQVEAPDLVSALQEASERIPSEVARDADLAEIRPAVAPDERPDPATGTPGWGT